MQNHTIARPRDFNRKSRGRVVEFMPEMWYDRLVIICGEEIGMNQKKICVLGSLNIDLTVGMERFHQPGETVTGSSFDTFTGGKGGNQAVAAARLGGEVHMVGCVGQDAHGDLYVNTLKEEGVQVQHIERTGEVSTGVALIEVDAQGENRIVVVPGANQALDTDLISRNIEAIQNSGALLLQLETPIESVTHAAAIGKRLGAKVILDPAPARPLSDALLILCDYITPNETELHTLTGLPVETDEEAIAACAQLLQRGAGAVLHKRGARGAMLVTKKGARTFPGYRVDPVDTTAAGDTFNAAFAVGLCMDMPVDDAIRLANGAAALSTTGMGAQAAMPDLYSACGLVEAGSL